MTHLPGVPIRTCLGCGARAPQAQLLRLAVGGGGGLQLVPGKQPTGRTGYLHRDAGCWERFAARKGPVRSLRQNVDRAERLAFVQRLKEVHQGLED